MRLKYIKENVMEENKSSHFRSVIQSDFYRHLHHLQIIRKKYKLNKMLIAQGKKNKSKN